MTGAELRGYRKAAGLSQTLLALRAGVSRECVRYWERKNNVEVRFGAPRRFCEVLGFGELSANCARARIWGLTSRNSLQAHLDALADAEMTRYLARAAHRALHRRVVCQANTRKGTHCRNLSEPGKRRCKFHGGKSTGPKTLEGKATIANAQRARWAKWRATRP